MHKWFSSAPKEMVNAAGREKKKWQKEGICSQNSFAVAIVPCEVSGKAWGFQWSEWPFPALCALYSCLLHPGGAGGARKGCQPQDHKVCGAGRYPQPGFHLWQQRGQLWAERMPCSQHTWQPSQALILLNYLFLTLNHTSFLNSIAAVSLTRHLLVLQIN